MERWGTKRYASAARKRVRDEGDAAKPSGKVVGVEVQAAADVLEAHVTRHFELCQESVIAEMVALTHTNMAEFSTPAALARTQADLEHRDMRVIEVRKGTMMLAFAAFRLYCDEGGAPAAYLYELQLDVAARGSNPSLGKALIAEVEERAALSGSRTLQLSCAARNERACGFYTTACGYSKIGECLEEGVPILTFAKACGGQQAEKGVQEENEQEGVAAVPAEEEEAGEKGAVGSRPPPPFAQLVTECILDWGSRSTSPGVFRAGDVRGFFKSPRQDPTNGITTVELSRAGAAAQGYAKELFTMYLPNGGTSDFDEQSVMALGAPSGAPARPGYGDNHAHIKQLLLSIKQCLSQMAVCYLGGDCALPHGLLDLCQKYSSEPVSATGEASLPSAVGGLPKRARRPPSGLSEKDAINLEAVAEANAKATNAALDGVSLSEPMLISRALPPNDDNTGRPTVKDLKDLNKELNTFTKAVTEKHDRKGDYSLWNTQPWHYVVSQSAC
jgi:ribosomal protein S18 acetylase RimI-like enzyme